MEKCKIMDGHAVKSNVKLLLIAVDGLSFPLVKKWSALGDLPTLKRLMDRGSMGIFNRFSPSNSAVIWTSVMTGMKPQKHGIDGFIYYTLGNRTFKKTAVKKALRYGIRPVFNWLKKKGYVLDVPFSLEQVKQKMLWEIFAQENRSVGIINWWYSWPVFQVPGFIISDRVHYWRTIERKGHDNVQTHLVHPSHLLGKVKEIAVDPFALPLDVYRKFMCLNKESVEQMKECHFKRHQLMSEFKYLYALDESVRRFFLFCCSTFPQPDFMAIYLRGVDIISHCALQYACLNRGSSISDEEIRCFGDTVHRYYCYIDMVLKEMIESVASDTTIMLVSDHGFEREPDGRFGHRKTKPPGFFVMVGPVIKKGITVENTSLYDIAPTFLYLAGMPLSEEMDGRLITEGIEESFLSEYFPKTVASYGLPLRYRGVAFPGSEEEIKERLRAVGYID